MTTDEVAPEDITLEKDAVAPTESTEVEAFQPTRRKRGRPSRFKPDADEGGVDVPPFTMEDVSKFLYERQAIWHRRFVEKLPEPWTEDETLRHWRVCNIFRELDAGTGVMYREIASRTDVDQKQRLLNVCVYRLINRAAAWLSHVGRLEPPYAESIAAAFERLDAAARDGEKVGTNTWRASALSETYRSCLLVAEGLDELHDICAASSSLRTAHSILTRSFEIGEFTAYQVALDVQYVYPNLDNSDWVFIYGHGQRGKNTSGGSMWAFRQIATGPDEEPIDVARRLRDTQEEWLPAGWDDVAWAGRPRLALVDVDNLMCEFRKYWLKRHGIGTLRRFGSGPEREAGPRRRSGGGGRGVRRSESINWTTPPSLFKQLDEEFHFTLDATASGDNHLLSNFIDKDADALGRPWTGETVYCFPPFGEMRDWTEKAAYEAETNGVTTVMLSPLFSETKWFHENVTQRASEIRVLRGMVQFYENGEPRPNVFQNAVAVLVFSPARKHDGIILPENGLQTTWGLTYPDRHVVPKSGWTGGGE